MNNLEGGGPFGLEPGGLRLVNLCIYLGVTALIECTVCCLSIAYATLCRIEKYLYVDPVQCNGSQYQGIIYMP